jgi:hypothetical protein
MKAMMLGFVLIVIILVVVGSSGAVDKTPMLLDQLDDETNPWFSDAVNSDWDNNATITLKTSHSNRPLIVGSGVLGSNPVVIVPKASKMRVGDQFIFNAELTNDSEGDYFYVAEQDGDFDSDNLNYKAPYVYSNDSSGGLVLTVIKSGCGHKQWRVVGGYSDYGNYTD